jgi:pSer/pThr/pTyr-binding forkhead associated (FHA) protein
MDHRTVTLDRPRLVIRSFPGGQPMEMAGPSVLIGRHTDADVRLAMPDVSRRHCRLVFDGRSWWVVDLGSTNGTFVNDERIDRAELRPGDHVRIGGFEFEVPAGVTPEASFKLTAVAPERRLAG